MKKYSYQNGLGYIYVRLSSGNYRLEHRVLVESLLNRSLKSHEVVHHINGNRADNSLKNLKVMKKSEHFQFHLREKETWRKKQMSLFDPAPPIQFELF